MHLLPGLAFGNCEAETFSQCAMASEAFAQVVPSMSVKQVRQGEQFLARFAMRTIGKTVLSANATLPCEIEVEEPRGWHIMIGYMGHIEVAFDRSSVELCGGRNALLMPDVRRTRHNARQSVIVASLDEQRLLDTVDIIAGRDPGTSRLEQNYRELDLRCGRELYPALQRLCALVDATASDPHCAELLGLEDVFYRWIAISLDCQDADKRSLRNDAPDTRRLDVVCDLIRSIPEHPITLTEMERISGMSARALQYAFKARFDCSPMEWQRQERIQAARKLLISAGPNETITSIAYSLGYSSSAAFATQYKHYFGESPSATLAMAA